MVRAAGLLNRAPEDKQEPIRTGIQHKPRGSIWGKVPGVETRKEIRESVQVVGRVRGS